MSAGNGNKAFFEFYKTAVETRQFEITMFWQRSNYFMILNTAIAAGFFSLKTDSAPGYGVALSLLGAFVCLCWLGVNLGGKYWQIRWEEAARTLEGESWIGGPKLFSATPSEMRQVVQQHQLQSNHGWFAALIDRLVLWKPSVSLTMILLSMGFIAFWLFLLGITVVFELYTRLIRNP